MCYMTSWSIKRPGAGKFTPDNIDPSLCTHVIYAFGTLKDFKLTFVDEKDTEQYKEMMALREKNANLKVSANYNFKNIISYAIKRDFFLGSFSHWRLGIWIDAV